MYNIVFSASALFWAESRAFLNSFWFHHKDHIEKFHIYIINYDLPDLFMETISLYPFKISIVDMRKWINRYDFGEEDRMTGTAAIARFAFPAEELSGVTMIIDADYFFLGSMLPFFDFATLGYILGTGSARGFAFGGHVGQCPMDLKCTSLPVPPGHEYLEGKKIPKISIFPITLDISLYKSVVSQMVELFVSLHHTWEKGTRAGEKPIYYKDYWLMNTAFLVANLSDKIFLLPPHQIGNLYGKMLLPGTRVKEDSGYLMTEDNLQPLLVHGKWGGRTEVDCRNLVRDFCKNDQDCLIQGNKSVDLLKSKYMFYLRGEFMRSVSGKIADLGKMWP